MPVRLGGLGMPQHHHRLERTAPGRLVQRRAASQSTSKPLRRTTLGAWELACRFSAANAMVFAVLSWVSFLMAASSLPVILSAPCLFFVGSVVSFVLFVRSGGAFAAVGWFVLGAGVYFGLGVFVSGLDPESVLLSDLLRVNILNSSSVALVLATAVPFAYRPRTARMAVVGQRNGKALLLRLFPPIVVLAVGSLGLQWIFFPIAENLIVRSFLSYFQLITPFCLLTLGMVWRSLRPRWVALGVAVFLLAFTLSLLSMAKLSVMSNVVALVAGTWVYRRSLQSVVGGLIVLVVVYAYIGPLANQGRLHIDYDAVANSPTTRLGILHDTIVGDSSGNQAWASGPSVANEAVSIDFRRFSVVDIQAYLMEQYDNGQPGTSLDDFWVAAVPRIFWPDKPIVTRFGAELYEQFENIADGTSNLAPTYTGEAYWNFGPLGVVVVSILVGLEIGWLTRRWYMATRGLDPAFFVIAFPTALWASFVESWIAAQYVGGFLTIVLLWRLSRFLLLDGFLGASSGAGRK